MNKIEFWTQNCVFKFFSSIPYTTISPNMFTYNIQAFSLDGGEGDGQWIAVCTPPTVNTVIQLLKCVRVHLNLPFAELFLYPQEGDMYDQGNMLLLMDEPVTPEKTYRVENGGNNILDWIRESPDNFGISCIRFDVCMRPFFEDPNEYPSNDIFDLEDYFEGQQQNLMILREIEHVSDATIFDAFLKSRFALSTLRRAPFDGIRLNSINHIYFVHVPVSGPCSVEQLMALIDEETTQYFSDVCKFQMMHTKINISKVIEPTTLTALDLADVVFPGTDYFFV